MAVGIQASGVLQKHLPSGLQIEAATVGEAVSMVDLPEVGELLLLVNGRIAHWQTELNDGDVLKLVPAIGGGS
jgi:sulfur carrier protein ThiS